MNHSLTTTGHEFVTSVRAHHVIVVLAVLVIGLGAKQYFSPPVKAEANIHAVSMNVLQMHNDIDMKNLPVQKVDDKTFIFSEAD